MGQITGTVKQILPTESGTSVGGNHWQKNAVVVTVPGEYPKDIAFTGMGKIVPVIENLKVGQQLTVHYELSSREYNGKWYSDIRAWKIDAQVQQAVAVPVQVVEQSEDLPF